MLPCLPFAPLKFQELQILSKFQENLIAFEQIPAIPAKFREMFIEKRAIWACNTQNFAKSGKIAKISQI